MLPKTRARLLWIALCIFIALALRIPLIEAHSRYFYHEDDAHHFNRTVEMAQRGDLNPHYFNKPALHFYLRMPIVYASVAWLKRRGEIASVEEIKTRDQFGLAGYAFTASHPTVLTWNRAWSVCMSLLVIALSCALAGLLGILLLETIAAALLISSSPEFLTNSDVIGVDIQMALFCVLSATVGVFAVEKQYSRKLLTLCGLVAGLAGATKYNAAPIALVPIFVAWYRDRSLPGFLLALATPAAGFLIGAPYSLLSFNEFGHGLSYEIWHYSVSGHEGHTAQPGLEQALFYLRWLTSDGLGFIASACAALGIAVVLGRRSPALITFLAFPLGYAVLMIAQKTNFTRNMVAVVPFVALLAALGISFLTRRIPQRARTAIVVACVAAAVFQPAARAVEITFEESSRVDSRDVLAAWLTYQPRTEEVAIDGSLQIPPSLTKKRGVLVVDTTSTPLARLAQQGFSLFVLPAETAHQTTLPFSTELAVPGEPLNKHAPKNPALSIVRVTPETLQKAREREPAVLVFSQSGDHVSPNCESGDERSCWLQTYSTTIILPEGISSLGFGAMSPWRGQELRVELLEGTVIKTVEFTTPGEWKEVTVDLPMNSAQMKHSLVFTIKAIHTPEDQGLNADTRRLGVAIRARS